jgi:dihydrofolate reductase
MRKLRYVVAMSLDGYIAGPNGEADWIIPDPDVNFAALWAQFDTLLMGRRTYEIALAARGRSAFAGMKTAVASRTLPLSEPGITVIPELSRESLRHLRQQAGKDIWLFGGGQLAGAVLEMGEVDSVEVSVVPVLLGSGIRLLPSLHKRAQLWLTDHRIYRSGTIALCYAVQK